MATQTPQEEGVAFSDWALLAVVVLYAMSALYAITSIKAGHVLVAAQRCRELTFRIIP